MKDHIVKFFIGAFGTSLIVIFRDVPRLPGFSHVPYWWVTAIVFMITGGIMTVIWQIGDDNPWRSFYFGVTWPALISLLTA
jgi:hypothetical protein